VLISFDDVTMNIHTKKTIKIIDIAKKKSGFIQNHKFTRGVITCIADLSLFFFLPSLGYKPAGPSIPLMSEKTLSHKFFYHFCCHLMGWGKIEKWLFLFYVMCFFFQPSSILLTCVSITISGGWPIHLCGVMVP